MQSKRSGRAARVVLVSVAVLGFAAASARAGKDAPPEVKRALYPAQNALGQDSLDLAEREARKALALDPAVTDTHLLLGEIQLRRGNLAPAREAYKKALELGGREADAHAGLALIAIAELDYAGGATEAQAALAADKGNWYANYAWGRILLEQGKADEAFKVFEKFKGLKGRAEGRDLLEIGMGYVALAERDPQGAETNFIKARALSPNTVHSTMALAALYESTGQWGQAANVLLAAEGKFGSSPVLSYRLGRAYEEQKQWNDALRQYQKAYKADSTYTPALAGLGHLFLLDRSKTAAAVEVLSRAVAAQPTPAARLDLGIALTKAGRAPEAIPHLEAVEQANPSPEGKVALGRAYIAAEQLDRGLPLYEDPDVALEAPATDLLAVANALIKAKRNDEARPWLDRALEKDPNLSEVYAKRGLIELMAKNYDAALENFQKKLEMDPKSATTAINMANVFLAQGRKDEALAAYRRATQMAPNSALAWLTLGQALAADSAAAAQKAFDRALVLDAGNVAAKRGKGLTFLVLEQYPQAISLLKEATQADPTSVEGWVWLGQAYLNSGNQAEARSAFQRALQLDPANKDAQDLLQQANGTAGSR